jgi:hypothetical protein
MSSYLAPTSFPSAITPCPYRLSGEGCGAKEDDSRKHGTLFYSILCVVCTTLKLIILPKNIHEGSKTSLFGQTLQTLG